MSLPTTLLRALVAAALVIVGAVAAPVAHADDGALVDVSITANSTPVIDLSRPDQVVELSGTVINTSARAVTYLTVQFWRDEEPIDGPEALHEVVADTITTERGRLFSEENGNMQVITRAEPFEPGERYEFRIRATVAELGFTVDDAAYVLGVHVRGIPVDGSRATVGRGHILAVATHRPIPVSLVVPLTGRPSRSLDGSFVDSSLADDVSGRLGQLLTAAEQPGATTLLDPSLLDDVRALAKPHRVGTRNEPGLPAARQWADRVESLIKAGQVLRLPWANPDLGRLASGDLEQAMGWAAEAVGDTDLDGLPLAADLGDLATPDLVGRLASLGFTKVLASNVATGEEDGVAVLAVAALDEPGLGPAARSTAAQLAGRRLAEDLLAPTPRVYLADTPGAAADFRRGIERRTLVPLQAGRRAPSYGEPGPPPPPWQRLDRRIQDAFDGAGFLAELTGTDQVPTLARIAATALSADFADEDQAIAFVATHTATTHEPDKITISAAKQFVMGSRTNNFPITVTNGMQVPVTVRVEFTSDSPHRIDVPPTELQTIEPGENLTLNVAPEATTNSVVNVHAQLATRDGRKFGVPVTIEIAATEFGRVGWIIIIVSGAVVLGGTFLRIRAVRAEKAKESSEH